jgi:hypothetical protein
MTVDELFEELEGAIVAVDGTLCYPQLDDSGEEIILEIVDGDIQLLKSEITKVEVCESVIKVYEVYSDFPYMIEVFERKIFEDS